MHEPPVVRRWYYPLSDRSKGIKLFRVPWDMIEKITSLLLGNKKSLFLFVLLLAIMSLWGATRIHIEDGTRGIFASSYPEYVRFNEHKAEFPQADSEIVIIARSTDEFSLVELQNLQEFMLDAQLIEGIDSAYSIFSIQKYDKEVDVFVNLLPDDLSVYPDMSIPLNLVEQSDWQILPLLNEQHNETVMVFTVEEQLVDSRNFQPTIDELKSFSQKLSSNSSMELEMTGSLPLLNLIVNRIIAEQGLLNAIGGILGALMSLILFRSLTIGLLNGIAPIFAVLMTLGAMGWLGLEMNVISNSVSILILVITMANCIHLTYELRRNTSAGKGRDESIRAMMKAIAAPCILTSLTTMVAMAGLFYSDSDLIRNFATAAIVGLILSIFAAIVIHPLVFAIGWRFPVVKKALTQDLPTADRWSVGFARTTRWLVHRKLAVVILSCLFALLLLATFLPIQTTHRFNEYLYDDEPMIMALKRAEAISSPTQSLNIVLRHSGDDQLLSDHNLETLADVHNELEKNYPEHDVYSLHNLRRVLLKSGEEAEAGNITEFLDMLPGRAKAELIGLSENAFKISFRVSDQPAEVTRHMIADIENRLANRTTDELSVEPVNGPTALAAHLSDQMIKELTISFLIAAFICPILIGLWFREWRFGLAAVLPNVVPVLIIGAWLMASGWRLQFTGAIALSIAFGVAVDDTIHVINRLNISRRKKCASFTTKDLPAVMQHVAPALITTTLVLSVGLSSTFFSEMPTVVYFGTMCMAIFFFALLADLFMLLPMIAILGIGPSKQKLEVKT